MDGEARSQHVARVQPARGHHPATNRTGVDEVLPERSGRCQGSLAIAEAESKGCAQGRRGGRTRACSAPSRTQAGGAQTAEPAERIRTSTTATLIKQAEVMSLGLQKKACT